MISGLDFHDRVDVLDSRYLRKGPTRVSRKGLCSAKGFFLSYAVTHATNPARSHLERGRAAVRPLWEHLESKICSQTQTSENCVDESGPCLRLRRCRLRRHTDRHDNVHVGSAPTTSVGGLSHAMSMTGVFVGSVPTRGVQTCPGAGP